VIKRRSAFDRAAHSYDSAAIIQQQVAIDLDREKLAEIRRPPETILEIGGGTGFLTNLILRRFPQSRVDVVEASAQMIELARARCADHLERVQWLRKDFEDALPNNQYDLIASSSALHWAADLPTLVERLTKRLSAGGKLAASAMLDGTLDQLYDLKRQIAPSKANGDHLPELSQICAVLRECNLVVVSAEEKSYQQTFDTAEELLLSLNRSGVNSRRFLKAPLNRSELRALVERYPRCLGCGTSAVVAQYRVGMFVGTRVES
jgi:malonyl-CoA O-methyltransferase